MAASCSAKSSKMNRLTFSLLIAATLVVAQTLDVDDIVARNIAARGGAQRLGALKSQRMTGTLSFETNPGEPFHVEMKHPGKIRQEILANHEQFTQVSDGREGWILRPGKPPEAMSPGQVHDLDGSADLQGPLFQYKEKSHQVELAGKDSVDGRDAYKLVITLGDRTKRTDFIDAKTFLELKWEGVVGGQKMESYFHDYRKVNGIAYAFSIESSGPGFKQKLVFSKIEVNIELPDSRFTKP